MGKIHFHTEILTGELHFSQTGRYIFSVFSKIKQIDLLTFIKSFHLFFAICFLSLFLTEDMFSGCPIFT